MGGGQVPVSSSYGGQSYGAPYGQQGYGSYGQPAVQSGVPGAAGAAGAGVHPAYTPTETETRMHLREFVVLSFSGCKRLASMQLLCIIVALASKSWRFPLER